MPQREKKRRGGVQIDQDEPTEPMEKPAWQEPARTGPDDDQLRTCWVPSLQERGDGAPEITMQPVMPESPEMPQQASAPAQRARRGRCGIFMVVKHHAGAR